mmetsp:Transcript_37008/g.43054  ORF Transcript_37008/g.43054 Transcript_37008/m.43054 type:complete len:84 (+) Transcript_37008:151-402(+)
MEPPTTPDSRSLICMDKEQNGRRYDIDVQIGPFFDALYDEPPLLKPTMVYISPKRSSSTWNHGLSTKSSIPENIKDCSTPRCF